jgi:hypothetical protein
MASLIDSVLTAGKFIDTPAVSRPQAVAAALEVIASYSASNSGINLEAEMKRLSSYADLIQEALKVK